jgi:hypothetical protein
MVTLADDGVLFAKNSDRDANEAQVLRWYPAGQHSPGTSVACTWSEVPQVERTHAVLLSQPWWMWGAEMGANDQGVVIGNEAVFTRAVGDRSGTLLGMDLLRLALERAGTAEAAVQVLVELLEAHGQGGQASHEHPRFRYDNSFLVADPTAAFVLETAGRRWAVEEVTGPGRSISNGLTIPVFARAHADPVRGFVASCKPRRARTQRSAAAATGVTDLFAALRDHGQGGAPRWSPVNGALSAPCAHAGGLVTATQSTASWVSDLRTGGRPWATGTAAPCTSLYTPGTVARPLDVDPDPMPTNRYDPAYRWWRHERLHRLAMRDYSAWSARLAVARDAVEADWAAAPPPDAEAFATADDLEAGWWSALVARQPHDTRPRWLRSLTGHDARRAGLPAARADG